MIRNEMMDEKRNYCNLIDKMKDAQSVPSVDSR